MGSNGENLVLAKHVNWKCRVIVMLTSTFSFLRGVKQLDSRSLLLVAPRMTRIWDVYTHLAPRRVIDAVYFQ